MTGPASDSRGTVLLRDLELPQLDLSQQVRDHLFLTRLRSVCKRLSVSFHIAEGYVSMSRALAFDRKNFIVNGKKVKRLRKILRAMSESEAVRVAVDRVLNAEQAIAALERLRKRGTWGRKLA